MSRDPNDDRSDSMNPNNDAYWDSLDNHADQLNPNNDEFQGPASDDDETGPPRLGLRQRGRVAYALDTAPPAPASPLCCATPDPEDIRRGARRRYRAEDYP